MNAKIYKYVDRCSFFYIFFTDNFYHALLRGIREPYYLFRLFRVVSLIFRWCLTKEGLEVI